MIQPTTSSTQSLFQNISNQPVSSTTTSTSESANVAQSGMRQTLELMLSQHSGDSVMDAQAMKMMIALYILQMLLEPEYAQNQSPDQLLDQLTNQQSQVISISMTSESYSMQARHAYQSDSVTNSISELAE